MEKKLQIPTEILCYGLPEELIFYLNYCKSLRFEDRPDYDYLRGLFIKLLGTCNLVYGLTKEMLKFDWCFEDPASSIWQIYNKKKHGNSNINSSFDKQKSEDVEGEKEKKPTGIKKKNVGLLKKQLSNIKEVNDFITNENNSHNGRSDSNSESSDSEGNKNKMSKKLEEEKNLIKEETESKLQSESEETVRESFQPIPKDLKEDKLTEELKTVFFTQAQTEQIDNYITQLMEPQKTINEMNENDYKKTENDIIDATMNNTINEINNNSNDKELISSGNNKEKNILSKRSNNKSNNELKMSKMEIGNMQNIDNSRLNMAGINSKNYSQEMEGKVNNIKSLREKIRILQEKRNKIIYEQKMQNSNTNTFKVLFNFINKEQR